MAPTKHKSKPRNIQEDENRGRCPDQKEREGLDEQQNITNRI